ncbi:MAG: MerR family transcriptional regulator [Candidatus Izemoplasmatales bacterium]
MTIQELAKISGVSTRTLRHYDEIGLLKASGRTIGNARTYQTSDVDRLQQILIHKEFGFSLAQIQTLLQHSQPNRSEIFTSHLEVLKQRVSRDLSLIHLIEDTLRAERKEIFMSDTEKFEHWKRTNLDENERLYRKEVEARYGKDVFTQSQKKYASMTLSEHERLNQRAEDIITLLQKAMHENNPYGEFAMKACEKHKQWIEGYWPKGHYSKEAHLSLVQMYVEDDRFRHYYDQHQEGMSAFFRQAMEHYLA